MNLRDLKYLVAVAETKHFGRAAQRCFVSQPTLSSQIKKLEESLGVTLFERTNRSVSITEVGRSIVDHARRSLAEAEAIELVASSHRDPLAGQIQVGAIPTLSPYLIPLILEPMQRRFPRLELALSDEVTRSLERKLQHHEIDVALLATSLPESGFEEIPLFDEPFWLVHPPNHPLYMKEEITCEDLREQNVLLLSDVHCLSQQVRGICAAKGISWDKSGENLRAYGLETLIRLVSAGHGCTLVPALAVLGTWLSGSGVIARKLDIPGARRRVRMVFRNTFPRRPALQALAEVIRDSLPNTVRRL